MNDKDVYKTFAFLKTDGESNKSSKGKKFRNKHLWIVLTNPDSAGRVGIISLSSLNEKKRQNPAFIIEPGEEHHPFIKRRSYVRYDAEYFYIAEIADIRAWIKSGNAIPQDDVREALVDKINHHVQTNDEAEDWMIAFINHNRHNPPPQPK